MGLFTLQQVSVCSPVQFTLEVIHMLKYLSTMQRRCMDALVYKETNSVVLVRKRTIPTERPLLVEEVSAYFSG
jgi:hypothetical protein